MTFATGAKKIDIGEYMVAKDITGLLKVINRALANRKTRDNATNDVSSRSICVLSFYIFDRKFTIVDLAGHERSARLEINEKRYREALFINECLGIIMGVTRSLSRGKVPDYTIHPVTHMTDDTLGGNANEQQTQIFVCVGPSSFDFQDTLNSN